MKWKLSDSTWQTTVGRKIEENFSRCVLMKKVLCVRNVIGNLLLDLRIRQEPNN